MLGKFYRILRHNLCKVFKLIGMGPSSTALYPKIVQKYLHYVRFSVRRETKRDRQLKFQLKIFLSHLIIGLQRKSEVVTLCCKWDFSWGEGGPRGEGGKWEKLKVEARMDRNWRVKETIDTYSSRKCNNYVLQENVMRSRWCDVDVKMRLHVLLWCYIISIFIIILKMKIIFSARFYSLWSDEDEDIMFCDAALPEKYRTSQKSSF